MKNFTPRHLRKKHSGQKDATKKLAFRRCARISNQFIHQSASSLAGPALRDKYALFCEKTAEGRGFRKG